MNTDTTPKKPLRLKAGIIIAVLILILRFIVPNIIPGTATIGALGSMVGSLAILVWWSFFSRAPRIERWGAVLIIIVTLFLTSLLIDVSIATGAQGMMFYMFALPFLCIFLVVWAIITQKLSNKIRRITMLATIILSCIVWTLFRIDGITGDFNLELAWRWSETNEHKLLTQNNKEEMEFSSDSTKIDTIAEWSGFRGSNRDGIINGVRIKTDWSENSPKELWRRQIGPGCSSFAVQGNLIYTQEQRGEYEMVSCYNLTSGKPVWRHSDSTRFWDSHAGAGPRSTPTLSGGRVYTLGATGIINVLNANDGSAVWSRNAALDNEVKHSGWGYTSSPLVIDDVVIAAIVGKLAAYDITTGAPRWFGTDGGDSYSSPHLFTIDGVKQVLLLSGNGVASLNPNDGSLLWEYQKKGGSRIVQPAITSNGDILIGAADGFGIDLISVTHESDNWVIEERWTSSQLKPNFNDLVVHKGHAFGFVGPSLVCIDIKDGTRKWKSGRYGGQIILLADQGILLILTEKGEIALVKASPDQFTELASIQAIEGRTWNHPVLINDLLLVRNDQEMVVFTLPLERN